MCGIVGCILKEEDDVAPILFDCISKLEYRGYDSIGLATFADDALHIKKDKGKIDEAVERYSVMRSLRAVDRADVVLMVINAFEGITEQDKKIAVDNRHLKDLVEAYRKVPQQDEPGGAASPAMRPKDRGR